MRVNAINRMYDIYNAQAGMATRSVDKPQSRDEIELSSQAKDFATIKRMIAAEEDVRMDKVQEIKEKIDNGTYDVTAKQVASKILSKMNLKG